MHSNVFMFPGQGTQYFGMGKELYEKHARFRLWMNLCDEITQPLIGESLVDVIYRTKKISEPFDNVTHSNPALISIQYCLAQVLMEANVRPDYLIGYSLGEITASIVGGAVSLESGLQLAVDFGKILEKETEPGAMLAIIDSPDIMDKYSSIFTDCTLTGKNFSNNFVVSGRQETIEQLERNLGQKNIGRLKLPVNYGFHTGMMDPIESSFRNLVRRLSIQSLRVPVISCQLTTIVEEIDEHHFWDVVRQPVNFAQTVEKLDSQNGDTIYFDVGPSGSLATSIKYLLCNDSRSRALETLNQFGRDLLSMSKAGVVA